MLFSKVCTSIDNFLRLFTNFLMVALVSDVSWQVFTRFVLDDPSSYTEELARFLLIWIAFLGSAHAFRKGLHLGLDYFVEKASPSAQRLCGFIILAVVAVFSVCVLMVGGYGLVYLVADLHQSSAALGISMSIVYIAIPISGLLFLLFIAESLQLQSNK